MSRKRKLTPQRYPTKVGADWWYDSYVGRGMYVRKEYSPVTSHWVLQVEWP